MAGVVGRVPRPHGGPGGAGGVVADADAESGSSAGPPGGVGRKDVSSPNGPPGLGASGVPGGRDAAALAGDDDGMRRMIDVVTKNFSEPVTYGL